MTQKETKRGEWVDYSPEEIEGLIVTLSNKGLRPSQIGLALREQYGVPSVKSITQKRITTILGEKGLETEIPEDLLKLIERSVLLQKHMEQNKKDFSAKRGYRITVSKIRRRAHYYVNEKKLPVGWKFTTQTAALLVR